MPYFIAQADTTSNWLGAFQSWMPLVIFSLLLYVLRHSAVTMLKRAGVSEVLAREFVGHESAAVSRQYTHLSTADMRAAMEKLPDVTNNE